MQRAAKGKSVNNQNPTNDLKRGVATWLTFLAIPGATALFPAYFNTWTIGIAVACFFIGISGLGMQLDKLTSKGVPSSKIRAKSSDVFTSVGIGLSFLLVWAVVNIFYYDILLVRWLSVFLLLFGLLGAMIGLVDLVFWYSLQKNPINGNSSSKLTPQQNKANTLSFWERLKTAFWAVGGIITIFAALLQALQIMKFIP